MKQDKSINHFTAKDVVVNNALHHFTITINHNAPHDFKAKKVFAHNAPHHFTIGEEE